MNPLASLQREIRACRACPAMIGPPIVGPAVPSEILLIGQAPGPREGKLGRPFAWTAGKTLFSWLERAIGADEATVRERVYIAAVARCFPGKAKGGGDRRPAPDEIARCRPFLEREVGLCRPSLVIPIGTLAIAEVLGHKGPLADVIGQAHRRVYLGAVVDVIPLPHPSGASTWHRVEPGRTLLDRALSRIAAHATTAAIFSQPGLATAGARPRHEQPAR